MTPICYWCQTLLSIFPGYLADTFEDVPYQLDHILDINTARPPALPTSFSVEPSQLAFNPVILFTTEATLQDLLFQGREHLIKKKKPHRSNGKLSRLQSELPTCHTNRQHNRGTTLQDRKSLPKPHRSEGEYQCGHPGCTYISSNTSHLARHVKTHVLKAMNLPALP